mmetsp:Transcript_9943/g.37510  ORF Transcript_9943/g.37510 Transcript_9943/m.37510 type:complete len:97 (-) Transcript_9943:1181-1471(-)|eukprot:scaffold4081_cov268-Pinguiococcus_pyrenoidosus.AAC.2
MQACMPASNKGKQFLLRAFVQFLISFELLDLPEELPEVPFAEAATSSASIAADSLYDLQEKGWSVCDWFGEDLKQDAFVVRINEHARFGRPAQRIF